MTRAAGRTQRRIAAAMVAVGALAMSTVPADSVSAAGRTTKATPTTRRSRAVVPARPTRPELPARPTSPRVNASSGPAIGGCPVFPADNPWNTDISGDAVHPMSATWVASVNASRQTLHPDTGSDPEYGIPFVIVPQDQPLIPVMYDDDGDESDPGPFPVPPDAPVEAGSDRHVIVVQQGTCRLVELFNARRSGRGWTASSGATWDLRSNQVRPFGWTSADAAGLPIFPGLIRVDEVRSGTITHALRFTVPRTQRGFIAPARHHAGVEDAALPPMGARFRLRADVDLSSFRGDALVVLKALQRYGMIVADNGSAWFITGARDPRWDDDDLGQLKRVPGSWFEVVDTGPTERR